LPATLQQADVHSVLQRLFEDARGDDAREAAIGNGVGGPVSAAELAQRQDSIYMPISREAGVLIYQLVRACKPATVVEFGMSFGISTIFLAAGIRDNGAGRVITTELSDNKVAVAGANLREAGLDDLVTILRGDARETLAAIDGSIELLLLDGWKDLYLPVLKLLEPQLPAGTLVLADDSSFSSVAEYLSYVRDPANGYESVEFPVEDGLEISCRVG
jgi:predicted O-methyltransferase YrrM